jgi:hypothetical protein
MLSVDAVQFFSESSPSPRLTCWPSNSPDRSKRFLVASVVWKVNRVRAAPTQAPQIQVVSRNWLLKYSDLGHPVPSSEMSFQVKTQFRLEAISDLLIKTRSTSTKARILSASFSVHIRVRLSGRRQSKRSERIVAMFAVHCQPGFTTAITRVCDWGP